MKKNRIPILAAIVIAGLAATHAAGQIQKGKTRPLQTKVWMKTVNQPHCGALVKMLKAGITEDSGWAEAAAHAQMLTESGHVLMADSRCPDTTWANAAKDLREGSEAMLKAIEAKDSAAASADLQKVLGACKACHAAHRKQ
ncbi:MAG: cytochrome c [Acidobacteria bacterium]|nr:cytochrome c [Acidobacteriota bacterium]